MSSVEALGEAVRRRGLDAGLDAVGIAGAGQFVEVRRVLEQRRDDGLSGGMQFTYRNPARSTEPARALPGAQSLVVGALGYSRAEPVKSALASPGRADPPAQRTGSVLADVARYSWVDHYERLREALAGVAGLLRDRGWRAKVLVDDNALVDRAAAYRAGLGWWGKNTNILLPSAGSWFVLGSVVTDAVLPVGEPLGDGCGRCRRCQVACPTGALVDARVLDARKCLAWLLQAPGVFPWEHRVALGGRLYGCDECQEVCPVNRAASRRDPPPPAEPDAEPWVDVLSVLDAGDDELQARFARWYIAERDPRYLRRNALVVLGNVADRSEPAVVAAVGTTLADADPLLRAHAVWTAARLGLGHLLEGVSGDMDPLVRVELAAAGRVVPRDARPLVTPR